MKDIYMLIIAGLMLAAEHVAAQDQEFSVPSVCNPEDCTYRAAWKILSEEAVEFSVSAKVSIGRWAGIGFSREGLMVGSDAVVGWATQSGAPMLTDRFLMGKSPDQVPVDSINNVEMTSFSAQDGMLKYSFIRPILSTDTADINLDKCIFLIFAWDGVGGPGVEIRKHEFKSRTSEKICFDMPKPMPNPAPQPMPRPVPRQMPKPISKPMPKPAPMPRPVPRQMPKPISKPMPKPAPQPMPRPVPRPMPKPISQPMPKPMPDDKNRGLIVTSCSLKKCQQNSLCTMEHGLARCYCKPDFPMDKYGNCRKGNDMSMMDKCKHVRCGEYEECHQDIGSCKCMKDYYMIDGRCQRGNDMTMMDKCKHVQCGEYAECHEDTGSCKCMKDYYMMDGRCQRGNDMTMMDKCKHVRCAEYAECHEDTGSCKCMKDYYMIDGRCQRAHKITIPDDDKSRFGHDMKMDKCKNVRCGDYAECHKDTGSCICMTGYHMADGICRKGEHRSMMNKCKNVKCDDYAECHKDTGTCKCMRGYHYRDGGCKRTAPTKKCAGHKCPLHAMCHSGKCKCQIGYLMSASKRCMVVASSGRHLCGNRYCPEHAGCIDNYCRCKNGYYMKDGKCKMLSTKNCGDHICRLHAMCHSGKCQCKSGYTMSSSKTCIARHLQFGMCKMKCHEYSHCNMHGKCQCNTGYIEHGGKCIKSHRMCMGKACYENAHCNYMKRCQCDNGYKEHAGTCKKMVMSKKSCLGRCGEHGDLRIGKCSCHPWCPRYPGVCCKDYHDKCVARNG
uniref:tenascin-X-like isoform X8 n=1 Tax=Styela clava TaxID=7725 RepID=UPI00193AD7F3|nr:tenascin-X-like isoform X8 [Styela clava]